MNDLNSVQPANSGNVYINKPSTSSTKEDIPAALSAHTADRANVGVNPQKIETVDEQNRVSEVDLEELTSKLNFQLAELKNYLRFEKHEDTERMVIFIKDSKTDEIIRQIPSKEFLDISKTITDYLDVRNQITKDQNLPPGLLANEKA